MVYFESKRFIDEIKARPSIWSVDSPDYLNKFAKMKAWEELCSLFVIDYDTLPVAEKRDKCSSLQKKWRNLRDSFTRELNAQKYKSNTRRPDRREYIYFNQLSFLRQTTEKRKARSKLEVVAPHISNETSSNTDDFLESDFTAIKEDPDNHIVEAGSPVCLGSPQNSEPCATEYVDVSPLPKNSEPVTTEYVDARPISALSRKRSIEQLMDTDQQIFENITRCFSSGGTLQSQASTSVLGEDQDRLFLLSLLDDLKKVHDSNKLEMKSEMIMLIKKWQRTPPAEYYQYQQFQPINPRLPSNIGPRSSYQWPEPSTAAYRTQEASSTDTNSFASRKGNGKDLHTPRR